MAKLKISIWTFSVLFILAFAFVTVKYHRSVRLGRDVIFYSDAPGEIVFVNGRSIPVNRWYSWDELDLEKQHGLGLLQIEGSYDTWKVIEGSDSSKCVRFRQASGQEGDLIVRECIGSSDGWTEFHLGFR